MDDDILIIRGLSAACANGASNPIRFSSRDVPEVTLSEVCARGLSTMRISSLFPVQKISLFLVVAMASQPSASSFDSDICIGAPTGSGKTLAYTLPIVHLLAERSQPTLRALVVLPTRELALQVSHVISRFPSVIVQTIIGQNSLANERDSICRGNCDIAVATMGRLIEHLVIGALDLSYLRWLVVDEADRMLSPSDFDKWNLVLGCVPPTARRLLFSATMTSNPLKLNKLCLSRPLFITVQTESSEINHKYLISPNKSVKVRCMLKLLEYIYHGGSNLLEGSGPSRRCLIFCRTGANVASLTGLLQPILDSFSIRVCPFSGNFSGAARTKLLRKFGKGSVHCLVSTDIITRGIDIPDIDVVINYDVPQHATTYLHRAGRTGRARKAGLVVSLVEKREMRHFRKQILTSRSDIVPFNIDFASLMKHEDLERFAGNSDEDIGDDMA
jgi:ATP-dependent RNA helicase DDX51/DBP6